MIPRLRYRLLPLLAAMLFVAFAGKAHSQGIEDSIQVPGAWVGSLAYNPQQDEVWGQTWSGNKVFVISAESNRVVAALPLTGPFRLGFDSTDNKMYVSYQGAEQDSLAVVDGATHAIIKRMEMPGATMPVWDPLSNCLYVSCQYDARVAVLDCATDSLLTYIPVGACPMKMYINTLRRKLYVLNYDEGSVSIVNMLTNQVIKTVVVGGYPNAGYYCRSADKFYSAGPHDQCIVIGGLTDSIVARIPMPGTEDLVFATGNEQSAIVFTGMLGGNSGYLFAIAAVADSVMYVHDLGHAEPDGLLFSTKSDRLYSANYPGSVSVLAGDGSRVIKTLRMGYSPFVFAQVPSHNRIYAGDLGRNWVYVIRDVADGIADDSSTVRATVGAISAIPNPFRRAVSVTGVIGDCPARIYSSMGELVRVVLPTWFGGRRCAVWDGLGCDGRPAPVGVYLLDVAGQRCKVVKAR